MAVNRLPPEPPEEPPGPSGADPWRPPGAGPAPADAGTGSTCGTVPETPPGGPVAGIGPRHVGRYQVLAELGSGGMGIVYQVRDTLLGRVVALKMIRGGMLAGPEELTRFQREAQAASQVRHPHIVPLFEAGEIQGAPFFTMPYLAGGSLDRQRQALAGDARAVVTLLEKVARAVHAAHEHGIVHRDLKPSNILLDDDGEPLVSDFGLAKLLDDNSDLTHTERVMGTPAYMAPEQAAGRAREADAASDVWSLGVILYELLTGRRPFEGKDTGEVRQNVLRADPPQPRALWPELDRGLEAIVMKCLQKDPCWRYESAAALADDLARWLRGEPLQARPEPWPRKVVRALRRRTRWLIAAGLVAAAVLLLAGGLLASRLLTPDPPRADRERRQEEARQAIESDLADGLPVTLVRGVGLPLYYKWRTEKDRPRLPEEPAQPLFLESFGVGLLELVADPQHEHYHFSAEVRLVSTNEGQVGIFFLGDEWLPDQDPEQTFCVLAFDEDVRWGRQGWVEWYLCRYREPRPERGLDYKKPMLGSMDLPNVPADPDGGSWHRLSVEVTPDRILASCDGRPLVGIDNPLAGITSASQVRVSRAYLGGEGPLPPFPRRGALGLFLMRGAAFFRNVVVTPLEVEQPH